MTGPDRLLVGSILLVGGAAAIVIQSWRLHGTLVPRLSRRGILVAGTPIAIVLGLKLIERLWPASDVSLLLFAFCGVLVGVFLWQTVRDLRTGKSFVPWRLVVGNAAYGLLFALLSLGIAATFVG